MIDGTRMIRHEVGRAAVLAAPWPRFRRSYVKRLTATVASDPSAEEKLAFE